MKSVLNVFVFVLCSYSAVSQTYDDIRPIIKEHCIDCHCDDGVAPFSLMTYADVSKKAKTIVQVIRSGYMPPWMPDPEYSHFKGERLLTESEIIQVENWVKKGKPNSKSFAEIDDVKVNNLDFEEDLNLKLEPVNVDTNVTDFYKTFIIPYSEKEDKNIKAVRFNPGNLQVVHHAWVFLDTVGYTISGAKTDVVNELSELGFPFTDILTAYLPGSRHTVFENGKGKLLYGGSNLVVQVHYYSPNGKFNDSSSLSFQFTEEPITEPVKTMLILEKDLENPPLKVPANEISTSIISKKITSNIVLHRIAPHMHFRGRSVEVYAVTPDNDTIPLIRINDWDFGWQGFYEFKNPPLIPAGSVIKQVAVYDNTDRNYRNPVVPAVDVFYGEGSLNEMCELAIEYVDAKEVKDKPFDMKETLKRMAENFAQSEQTSMNAVATSKRLQTEVAEGDSSIDTRLKMGLYLMFEGKPKVAEEVFNELSKLPPISQYARYFAALTHLYDAELINCFENHNQQSCIFPFGPMAIHQNREGSTKAIKLLEELVADYPGFYEGIWLLNVAKETLGIDNDLRRDSLKSDVKFVNLSGQVGVDNYGFYGGAVIEDFDNDGFLDLLTCSGSLLDNLQLYRNLGTGKFDNVTEQADLLGITGAANLIHGDVNNDGLEDVYALRGGWLEEHGVFYPNSLLINRGNLKFEDVTSKAGLLEFTASHTACFADFNQDGYLDLFVGNEKISSKLYINNGDGTFSDESVNVGVQVDKYVKGVCSADFDGNGFPDIYLSVYKGKNLLYYNQGFNVDGNLTFEEVGVAKNVTEPNESFVTSLIDFNNDGHMDILCPEYTMDLGRYAYSYLKSKGDYKNKLYLNDGEGNFTDVSTEVGINIPIEPMSVNVGDVNNDGYQDVYFGTGWPNFEAQIPNVLLINENGERFRNETGAGLGHLQKGHGVAFGDVDNDGDQDIYHSLGGLFEANRYWDALFLNEGVNSNNWITLKLIGATSNRSAIGARIEIKARDEFGERTYRQTIGVNGSYGSSSLQAEMGLGNSSEILEIKILWPSGKVQFFNNLSVNQAYQVNEQEEELVKLKRARIPMSSESAKVHEHHNHHH